MSRVGRANSLAQARRRSRSYGGHSTSAAFDEKEADRMEARAKALAPALGFCGSCGATVNEAKGELHSWDCPHVAPERRRARRVGER